MIQVVVPTVLAAQAEGRKRFDVEAGDGRGGAARAPVSDLLFNERGELISISTCTSTGRTIAIGAVSSLRLRPRVRSGSWPWLPAASSV